MRGAVQEACLSSGLALPLVRSQSHEMQVQHNAAPSARLVLNLAPILGFAIDCDVHRQPTVVSVALLRVPLTHRFIGAE